MTAARAATRLACCLLVPVLVVPAACTDDAAGARDVGRDVVLLVGADTFAAGDRAARLLEEAAGTTDVLGPARFEMLTAPGGRPSDLPPLLARRLQRARDVRAVVAVLGDLTLLTGIDPSLPPHVPTALTSRVPRTDEMLAARAALAAGARAHGAAFVCATAPLGRQGRVEVPELLGVAEALRAAGPVLDLQAAFLACEDEPWFANGIDRLDEYGHDELARLLLPALLDVLPPRDEDERVARLQAEALSAFAQGRDDEWRALLPQVEATPARAPRAASRRAALLSAAEGLLARAADWAAIDAGTATDVPGLAAARALRELPPGDLQPTDPIEQAVLVVMRLIAAGSTQASDVAAAAVAESPQRLEAWVLLQLAGTTIGPPRDWRGPARRTLRLFTGGPVDVAQAERLLDGWPAPLDALPALLCASRATASHLPCGPLLSTARRRAALGYTEHAAELLRPAMEQQQLPPTWRDLIERWTPP